MATKVDSMNWLDLVDAYKLKPDGLKDALRDYAESRARDECDGALKALATLAKLGTTLKSSKEVKVAGPDVIKRIGKLLDGVATSQKEWEKKKAERAQEGTQQDIQIQLERWDGKSMYGGWAKVEISPRGGKVIKKEVSTAGTILNINDVFLQPVGMLTLSLYRADQLMCTGTAKYQFTPGKDKGLQFMFSQKSTTVKKKAKSLEELSDRLEMKGSVGLEIKVLKVGGEVTKETAYKKGYEEEVEWEVEMGEDKFKVATQI